MNTLIRSSFAVAILVAASAAFGYQVSNVSARQHWPWDNKVDVDFTLSDAAADKPYRVDIAATYPGVTGDELTAKTILSEPIVMGNGMHRLVWDVGTDAPGLFTSNFNVRVTLTPYGELTPVYMVIDLSGGPTATKYPVRYTTQAPDLSDDTCRTTEMWLRRCPAGTFTMGNGTTASVNAYPAHTVVLTKPFYIGIFEVTRAQFAAIDGKWPAGEATDAEKAERGILPVTTVSYYDMWGSASPMTMVGNTYLGYLKTRSGLDGLDLPTEAQWEYACRAGTTGNSYLPAGADITKWASGAWFQGGVNVGRLYKVGSYPENPWGLYDMYGNVFESCRDDDPIGNSVDKVQQDIDAGIFDNSAAHIATYFTDPKGWPGRSSSTVMTIRGGSYKNGAETMTSSYRLYCGFQEKHDYRGFRVCVTVQ